MKAKNGIVVCPGDVVETVSGKIRTVDSIDKDGYARLVGELSTVYIPNLPRSMAPGDAYEVVNSDGAVFIVAVEEDRHAHEEDHNG